jgi:phage-related holin
LKNYYDIIIIDTTTTTAAAAYTTALMLESMRCCCCRRRCCFIAVVVVTLFYGVNESIGKLRGPTILYVLVFYIVDRNVHGIYPAMSLIYNDSGV